MFAISHAIDLRPVLRTGRCVKRGRYGQIRGQVKALLMLGRADGGKERQIIVRGMMLVRSPT